MNRKIKMSSGLKDGGCKHVIECLIYIYIGFSRERMQHKIL